LGEPGFERLRGHKPRVLDKGPNLYAYVRNNPLNLWDIYGLSPFSDCADECDSKFKDNLKKTKITCEYFAMAGGGAGALFGGVTGGGIGLWAPIRARILGGGIIGVVGGIVGGVIPLVTVPIDVARWLVCMTRCGGKEGNPMGRPISIRMGHRSSPSPLLSVRQAMLVWSVNW
jgi:hypothetical protein